MAGGYRDGEKRYCSLQCYTASPLGTFCPACLACTSAQSPGGTFTFNSIGTTLWSAKDRCPTCHSVVQTKNFGVLFLPLIPLGKFRMIYVGPKRFLGRKVTSDLVPNLAPRRDPVASSTQTPSGPEPLQPR
jgi:hypothetical protein